MRTFIVLALVALARANVGGYNYGAGGGDIVIDDGGADAGALGGSDGGGDGSLGGGSYGGGSLSGGSVGGGSLGGGSYGGGSLGGGSEGGGSYGGGTLGGGSLGGGFSVEGSLGGGSHGGSAVLGGGSTGPVSTEFSKEFYSFTAPEAEFDEGKQIGDLTSSLKKNLRVVFIRAPEGNGLAEAALHLAKSAVDSKTAIYVLTKQGDVADLANKLQNLNSQNANKPEVHFVKYRTHEDAANAQHAIQQQYHNLPGSSQSHDGGVAPVLDFASKAPVHPAEGPSSNYILPSSGGSIGTGSLGGGSLAGGSLGGGNGGAPSATYLPIVKF